MAVPAVAHFTLPEPPYDLWLKGGLLAALGIRDDANRAEIIGGEIVVSPLPPAGHADLVAQIRDAFEAARAGRPWRYALAAELNLKRVNDGYIPDLVLLDADDAEPADGPEGDRLLARQARLVVEVATRSDAQDRRLGDRRRRPVKWGGYASEGVEYCLRVDRDPRAARTTLFADPDPDEGVYRSSLEWPFGETVTLPAPFGVEIPTRGWQTWDQ